MKVFVLIPLLILIIVVGTPFSNAQSVPDWVKNTAEWWSSDAISEREFVNAIEFLVNVGIIQIESSDECVEYISNFFDNEEKIMQACNEHESNITELIPHQIQVEFNSEGFRGAEFSIEKPSDIYRIFMIGGSTMFSAEVDNDATIPSILEKMFEKQELDLEIEVINAGIGGGNTTSELELIKSKIVSYNPDLIIMYDGWNDISADMAVWKTLDNWEDVCAIGFREEIDVIITLQPIAGFGDKVLTQQEKINSLTGQDHNEFQLIQGKSTYDWTARELQRLGIDAETQLGKGVCETYDLRNIFDDVNGAVYYDQGHVMHTGNLILAEKFFELSMKKIDSSFVSDKKFKQIISNYNSISIQTYLFNEIGINDETFQNRLQDISDIDNKKGKFFELKEEFSDETDIFVGKDLRGINLNSKDLRGHNLTGANLSGQDLQNIDLSETIIRGANLSNTNLQGKNLSGMDLRGINFSGANLKDVDFTDAIFSKPIQSTGKNPGDCSDGDPIINVIKNFKCGSIIIKNEEIRTYFTDADLTNATFGGGGTIQFVDFTGADLIDVDLNNVGFYGADFTNANLNGISGNMVFLLESDFSNSQMNNFEISDAWFQSSYFYDNDMMNGSFYNLTLIDMDFSGTNFQGTEFTNINEIENSNNYDCKNNSICD